MRLSLVLFSKYAHLSFEKKKKEKFSLEIRGNAFSSAALTKRALPLI